MDQRRWYFTIDTTKGRDTMPSPKFLKDGTPNPNYRADRHTSQTDRHKTKTDRHKPGTRNKTTKFETVNFIAWDGEGVNPKTPSIQGEQWYSYLANSEGFTLTNYTRRLSTEECFSILIESAKKYPAATNVIFGGSYDVNMWLRDIPEEYLRELYADGKTDWKNYRIEYVPRKTFTLRQYDTPKFLQDKKGDWHPNYKTSFLLWDVFSFFGCRFIDALKEYKVGLDYLAMIEAGKQERNDFSVERLESFIIPYCNKEIDLLKQLMEQLQSDLQTANLPVSRWDGAGAIATSLMKREGIKAHLGKTEVPAHIQEAFQHAFSGGRIECLLYGHTESTVYHYDINSAYPYAMLDLPSMHGGAWEEQGAAITSTKILNRIEHMKEEVIIVSDISFNFPGHMPMYPFTNRDLGGGITYPSNGRNWIYGIEVVNAAKVIPHIEQYITIHKTYTFHPSTKDKPFSFIRELFQLRKEWKRQGIGAQKIVKTGINSLYGKLIQHTGYKESDRKKEIADPTPPFFQLQWAGYITAKTRSSMFLVAMQSPEETICFATDGVFSRVPLNLTTGSDLGEWEYEVHPDFTIVQSGVYWYSDMDGNLTSKYRGFDHATVQREDVLRSWREGHFLYRNYTTGLGVRGASSTRFITLGSALAGGERFKLWCTWHRSDRDLKMFASGKRREIDGTWEESDGWKPPYNYLRRTLPAHNPSTHLAAIPWSNAGYPDDVRSTPYPLPWETRPVTELIEGVDIAIVAGEYTDSIV